MNKETRPGLESGWIEECRDATFVHPVEVRELEEDGLSEDIDIILIIFVQRISLVHVAKSGEISTFTRRRECWVLFVFGLIPNTLFPPWFPFHQERARIEHTPSTFVISPSETPTTFA